MLGMPLTSARKIFNDRDEIVEFGSAEELMEAFAKADPNEDAYFVVSFGDNGVIDFETGDAVSIEDIKNRLDKLRRRWLVENHFPIALRDTRPDIAAAILAACPANQNRNAWFGIIAADLADTLNYQGLRDPCWKTNGQRLEAIITAMTQAEYDAHMARRPKHMDRDAWKAKLLPDNPEERALLKIVAEATEKRGKRKLAVLRKLIGMTQQEISIFVSSQKGPGGQVAVTKLEAQEEGEASAAAMATYVLLALSAPEQRAVAAAILRRRS